MLSDYQQWVYTLEPKHYKANNDYTKFILCACVIWGILIFSTLYIKPTAALVNIVPAPKNDTLIVETTKEPIKVELTAKDLKGFLLEVSIKYGQDYEQMKSVIQEESGFNPVVPGDDGVSIGIAQFKLGTWLGYCGKTDERTDPYKSMDCMGKLWKMGYAQWWSEYCLQYGKELQKCDYVFEYFYPHLTR